MLSACTESDKSQSPVERLGLAETTIGRALVEEAIARANAIAGDKPGIRLAPSWQQAKPTRHETVVFLIAPGNIAAAYSVMVPAACKCVFIQPRAFEEWVGEHSTANSGMLAIDHRDILTIMLLHEIGHIVRGDPGQFEAERGNSDVNIVGTAEKQRETDADRYALDLIVAASQSSKAMEGWLGAMAVQLALTNLSWNLASKRFIGNFGATTLCSRNVFGDPGYTHPNLELRILTMNALLANTNTAWQLVKDFETCRNAPRQPSLLGVPLELK
jgi:hypothetical protein